jgi:hypothetical protein
MFRARKFSGRNSSQIAIQSPIFTPAFLSAVAHARFTTH